MARVLLVDDDPSLPAVLVRVLSKAGHDVEVAASGEQAVQALGNTRPDLVLLDVNLPGMNGLETFAKLQAVHADLIGVFMTAYGSIRSAVDAMRAGGFDYLTEPFDNDDLLLTIDRALEMRRLGEEVRLLPRIAASDETVLILGESGTGKELVARNLHRGSGRSAGPFVAVNCSAIPLGLFESEFFGHERGAFTDARARRIGRFEQAQGGTLFLDEVAELALEAQAKLLRVLEDRQVVRLGGREAVDVDLRVVAATNKDIAAEVAAGRFRQDLYWRINVVTMELPPLRDRSEDLPLLIRHFIDRLNSEMGRRVGGASPQAMKQLLSHAWPGNIRELENALRRAFVMAEGDLIGTEHLRLAASGALAAGADARVPATDVTLAEALARSASRLERELIDSTLARYHGNRNATAEALGVHRKTLLRKIRQHALTHWVDGSDADD